MTVGDVYKYLDKSAPFNSQDKSDNAGMIVGRYDAKVEKILVCLDLTKKVIAEAVEERSDLIITHHPLIHSTVTSAVYDDQLHALTCNNINLIVAHTNFDIAIGGIADLMLARLGFPKSEIVILPINPDGSGFGRIVELDSPISAKDLAVKCKAAFNSTIVRYTDFSKALKKIGVTSGSAEESVEAALNAGCDAFVCGEVSHDRVLFAADNGLTLIEAGHFQTEDILCEDIIYKLKQQFKKMEVKKSINSVDVCNYV